MAFISDNGLSVVGTGQGRVLLLHCRIANCLSEIKKTSFDEEIESDEEGRRDEDPQTNLIQSLSHHHPRYRLLFILRLQSQYFGRALLVSIIGRRRKYRVPQNERPDQSPGEGRLDNLESYLPRDSSVSRGSVRPLIRGTRISAVVMNGILTSICLRRH